MDTSMIILVPVLVLGVVSLFAFAGCGSFGVADSPTAPPDEKKPDEKKPEPPKNGNGNGTVKVAEAVDAYPKLVLSLGGPTGHLRSYWRLAEVLGAQPAADSEPTQPMPGTYKGGVVLNKEGVLRLGSDPNDAAAEFNGTDAFVEVKNHPLVNPQTQFTLEAWIRPAAALPAGAVGPVITSFQPVGAAGFKLSIVGSTPTLMKARIEVGNGVVTTLDANMALDTPAVTARDGWHHIVASFGPDAGLKRLRLIVDGGTPEEVTSAGAVTLDYAPAPENQPGDAPFRIGAGPERTPTQFFNGRIDEVALYDAALDGGVVASHFTQATKKFK